MSGKTMAINTLQRIRGLIESERALAVLLPEAERLAAIDRRLRAMLPPRIGPRCRAMSLEAGTLVVHCDNAAAASRLRSQAKSLAGALSTPRLPVTGLTVKVRADWGRAEKPEKTGLGREALTALDEFAGQLPDGALRAALARMLEHQRR